MPPRAQAQADPQAAITTDPPAEARADAPVDTRAAWRPHLGLTAFLLAVWFGVSFGIPFFARDLAFDFFGWPFGFWIGAQGAPVAYWLICTVYAWRVNKREAQAAGPDGERQH